MTDYKNVFLDTSPWIYLFEDYRGLGAVVENFLEENLRKKVKFQTSVISVMEFSVKPIRLGNKGTVEKFLEYLKTNNIVVTDVDIDAALLGADLRARYKFLKGMDAIQVATAIQSGNDIFFTNDQKLLAVKEIEVVIVKNLSS
jgi:predicted nucleic acid-binding protein